MGEVTARCEILARLLLDPRALEPSGRRLIEWAKMCLASGVVIPRTAEPSLAQRLGRYASERGLSWHVESGALRGYTDESPEFIHALNAAVAGTKVVIKGLTLNRSLGGPAHTGSLYPDEFAELVFFVRYHERLTDRVMKQIAAGEPVAGPPIDRSAESLAYLESFVAAKSLAAGQVIGPDDVKLVPELCGLTAGMASRVLGSRLRDARQPGEPITFGVIEPWTPRRKHDGGHDDIAVVIRAKNEAAWLPLALSAIVNQHRPPKEIVLVDNDSKDGTRDIGAAYGCTVRSISDQEFQFGLALNLGIEATTAPWVVSLSAHCVPVSDRWLDAFRERAGDAFVAGIYGRQEPLPSSTDFDKRDLWTTFGEERRRQRGRDHFFHNANSLIQRTAWECIKFDDALNGVEDRDWARRVLADGYVIEYAPLASVHHHHGIHQGRNEARAQRVVRVIEFIQSRDLALEGVPRT